MRMVIGGRLTVTGVGGGTSALGPIVAGLVALLNADRLDAGKPSLGLANPLFYQVAAANAGAFKPIGAGTGGSNSNQCMRLGAYVRVLRPRLARGQRLGPALRPWLDELRRSRSQKSLQVATAAAAAEGERIVCPRLD